jgi:ubiquinone/menaquinone biosynthesis C-methylase UbiE
MIEKQSYDYHAEQGGAEYSIHRIMNDTANRERLEATIRLVPQEAQSLLDVGCGGGVFTHLLQTARPSMRLVGAERSYPLLALADRQFNQTFVAGSADTLPFASRSFDILTALEVIEHLPYGIYEQSLREIARVAKAWVLISVPYKENRKFIPCPYCGCRFNPYYHMHTFDEAKMQTLLEGFEAVEIQKVHIDRRPPLYNTMYNLYFRNTLPPWAVCPGCGYKKPDVTSEMFMNREKSAGRGKLVNRLQRLYLHDLPLPRIKSYRWIMTLYRRKA